ncbi:MAG: hypothetical protein U0K95_00290 [Eubacterium sp.]|nr:hypothetical protein [Eubacterium sp.]
MEEKMREYLKNKYGLEPTNENPEMPFRVCFFRLYDRKIASGEITFSKLNMDKDAFICLSTAQDPELTREDIINLCINMKLTEEEADRMMQSAGYEEV